MSQLITHAQDDTFESDVLKSDQLVLVDFWADWCGPCKAIAPILDEVASTHPQLKIVKVNVDKAPGTPAKYGVRGIPTLILFKSGGVLATHVGALSKSQLNQFIEPHL